VIKTLAIALSATFGLHACLDTIEAEPSTAAAPVASTAANEAVSVPSGFSWVDGQLGGMAHPGYGERLTRALSYLEDAGTDVLVSLTVTPTDANAAAAHGIALVHIPLRDFTAPTQAQLAQFLRLTRDASADGRNIVVHCGAGLGRTGTFLAAFFVDQGMTAAQAVAHVRQLRPGSIETEAQLQSIHDFAAL
jgi:atypical dual specificity phosphatase